MTYPLLLLPDFMCDLRLFGPQLAVLGRDRPLVAVPMGRCERVESFASDLLDHAPPRFVLAGQGLGGAVALEVLRKAGDRIRGLALIGTTFQSEAPAEASAREAGIVAATTGRFEETMRAHVLKSGLGPGPDRTRVTAELIDMARSLGPDAYRRQSRALQRRPDQQATLRQIKCPALVLGGGHDAISPPKRQSFLAEMIRDAEFVLLEEAGRFPTLERPDETLSALVGWLSRLKH
ncbi:alpha/beta fold hydrolase [Histidinibacterium lentulum]|uniref:Alpha/beta fold hydrolase n=1 Tax=Histidinibacterium lentulum TaxID=2480588 RepID=A0A3N2QTJ6_9RHOB|nr:alpha/beta hydrolase [Histidinibacterium lentulum]ROT98547.1 alpha/beta fold hydrolase [Histidinibacterium lentulum]